MNPDIECANILVNLSLSQKSPQEILHDLGIPRVPKIRTFEDCKADFRSDRCRCRMGKGWAQTDNPYDLEQCSNLPQKGEERCWPLHPKFRSALGYYDIDFWETNPTGKWDSGHVMFTK